MSHSKPSRFDKATHNHTIGTTLATKLYQHTGAYTKHALENVIFKNNTLYKFASGGPSYTGQPKSGFNKINVDENLFTQFVFWFRTDFLIPLLILFANINPFEITTGYASIRIPYVSINMFAVILIQINKGDNPSVFFVLYVFKT